MFVDDVSISIRSGDGGAGSVSFRREKFVIKGGPDGGDGGDGGDVYFKVDSNSSTLSEFRGNKYYKAKNGSPGLPRKCAGKKGSDVVIRVPPGTQVFENENLLLDLTNDGELVMFLKGGKGGLGNSHFKSSTNQRPLYAQKGVSGVSMEVRLKLKVIADVALVGFPNSGKSSLISAISNSRPLIADYEFSTLTPNLGVVNLDHCSNFVVADIPGIIEGASNGRGLGISFLQHAERSKLLLFLLDPSREKTLEEQFNILRREIDSHSYDLKNKPYAVAVSKADLCGTDDCRISKPLGYEPTFNDAKNPPEWRAPATKGKSPEFILPISSAINLNLRELKLLLFNSLRLTR